MFHMREIKKLCFCSTVACYCSAWQMMMGTGWARSDCFPIPPSSASHSPFFPSPSLLPHWALVQKAVIGSGLDRVPIWLQQQLGWGTRVVLDMWAFLTSDLTNQASLLRMCERITLSPLWHLSLASRWGNYQSGHRLHLTWWNYTFCICHLSLMTKYSKVGWTIKDDVAKNVPRNTLLIYKPRNFPKFWKHLFNPVQRNCCK